MEDMLLQLGPLLKSEDESENRQGLKISLDLFVELIRSNKKQAKTISALKLQVQQQQPQPGPSGVQEQFDQDPEQEVEVLPVAPTIDVINLAGPEFIVSFQLSGTYYIQAHENLVAKGNLYSQYTSQVKKLANQGLREIKPRLPRKTKEGVEINLEPDNDTEKENGTTKNRGERDCATKKIAIAAVVITPVVLPVVTTS